MSTDLVHTGSRELTAADFSPLMSVDEAVERKKKINQFITGVMDEGVDFGVIPGTNTKKVLLKPGAEKLCSIFGLAPKFPPVQVIEDWMGKDHNGEPLFYYEYRCELYRGDRFLGEGIGSCNSWESKYRYRWVSQQVAESLFPNSMLGQFPSRSSNMMEFDFAIEKSETSGKYGKPVEYWEKWKDAIESGEAHQIERESKTGKVLKAWEMAGVSYRIPNPDIPDQVNTCQKMAQKRALIAAVLIVTNCSDSFTQDILEEEDAEPQASKVSPVRQTTPEQRPQAEPPIKTAAMVEGFKMLKESLADDSAYYQILERYGVQEASEFKQKAVAVKCFHELESLIEERSAKTIEVDPFQATQSAGK